MRSGKTFRTIMLSIIPVFIVILCITNIGYAEWSFSKDTDYINNIVANINTFIFWENEESLNEEAHNQSDIFETALNGLDDSSSTEGQALKKILNHVVPEGYVGNMSVNSEVRTQMQNLGISCDASDCAIILKVNDDGSYDLYMTYENIMWKSNGTKVTAYHTHYSYIDGQYYATRSDKGKIAVCRYSSSSLGILQKGMDPSTFVAD